MKKSIRILFAALAATTLALAVSCSKEENGQTEPATASKVSVNITGAIGDYVPAEGLTKATVESVVRVKWGG